MIMTGDVYDFPLSFVWLIFFFACMMISYDSLSWRSDFKDWIGHGIWSPQENGYGVWELGFTGNGWHKVIFDLSFVETGRETGIQVFLDSDLLSGRNGASDTGRIKQQHTKWCFGIWSCGEQNTR